jgi:hypothetical protein
MALFRPWRFWRAGYTEVAARVVASYGMTTSRGSAQYHDLHGVPCRASKGIFVKGLYSLLAIILLHDIFAPHPLAPSLILSDSSLSVQALDENHPSAAEYLEDDENTSFPNRRGTVLPALSVNFNSALHSCFHPLLLIAADERPPKA